jgi:large conductance mechanosensitive channel
MVKLLKEFRDFALKGNMLDLAVGIIIGATFGGIVNSLIADMIMPVVGMAGNADFNNWYIGLNEKVRAAAAAGNLSVEDARKIGPVLAYGKFLTVLLNFVILAFCIFIVVKIFNTARKAFEKEKAAAPAEAPAQERLLMEIRDILKAK